MGRRARLGGSFGRAGRGARGERTARRPRDHATLNFQKLPDLDKFRIGWHVTNPPQRDPHAGVYQPQRRMLPPAVALQRAVAGVHLVLQLDVAATRTHVPMAPPPPVTGVALLFQPWSAEVIGAFTSPGILLGTGFYLVLKPLLRASGLVDTRKGAYKQAMIAYNLAMAVFSAGCFVATATALGWDRGYGKFLLEWSGDKPVALYTNQCPAPVFESKLFMMAIWAFYYSKYVEYLDTAWLVLKGKPVSFLQTFHHFGAPWDVYLGIVLKNEGLWIFMFLNAFIHTVMYSYYAISAAGISYPAKPLITMMQIFQFFSGFYVRATAAAPGPRAFRRLRPRRAAPRARRPPTAHRPHADAAACRAGGLAVHQHPVLPCEPRRRHLLGLQLRVRRRRAGALHALLLQRQLRQAEGGAQGRAQEEGVVSATAPPRRLRTLSITSTAPSRRAAGGVPGCRRGGRPQKPRRRRREAWRARAAYGDRHMVHRMRAP